MVEDTLEENRTTTHTRDTLSNDRLGAEHDFSGQSKGDTITCYSYIYDRYEGQNPDT